METIIKIFGQGKDLTTLQMGCRTIIVFFLCLLYIRIAGRRAFGQRSAFDNIIGILLGAIASRAVVGASPFIPTMASSLIIVVLHRLLAWLSVRNDKIGALIKGNKILLYRDGKFYKQDMEKSLISEKDMQEGIRLTAQSDSLKTVREIYMERCGEISIIKKTEYINWPW